MLLTMNEQSTYTVRVLRAVDLNTLRPPASRSDPIRFGRSSRRLRNQVYVAKLIYVKAVYVYSFVGM